jgi:site-specific DNA-methyltransferase (cytosine-N4-specific)
VIVHEDDMLTVYCGDVRAELAAVPADSVQTVVTSPPYYSLRDYGIPPTVWGDPSDPTQHIHEWGLSATRQSGGVYLGKNRWQHQFNGRDEEQPGDRRQRLEEPFRVAGHPDIAAGSFCECGAWLGALGLEPTLEQYVEHVVEVFRAVRRVLRSDGTLWLNVGDSYASQEQGLKAKDRMLVPARVAIALQADGWWLRDEIVWHKPNPMPSSITDRTTPAHEMVYLLTKRARYHYDADAIRERLESGPSDLRKMIEGKDRIGGKQTTATDPMLAASQLTRVGRKRSVGSAEAAAAELARRKTAVHPNARGLRQAPEPGEPNAFHPLGRNKRSVWTIATQPYPEAHFATFPEALVEPMILAGSKPGDVVLDPFGGSGTVAMVANRLGRKAVHVDLSEEYIAQAIKRIGESRATGDGPAIDMPVPLASDGLWAELG